MVSNPKLSYQIPINPQKLGIIEPWPECQEIDRRLKQNTTVQTKVSTLLGVYSDYHQKVYVLSGPESIRQTENYRTLARMSV